MRKPEGPMFSLGEIGLRLGLVHRGDEHRRFVGVALPEAAGPEQIAPILTPERVAEAAASRAGAFLVRQFLDDSRPQLLAPDPARALGQLLELFVADRPWPRGIDSRAAVDPTARIDAEAWVGPFAYVGPRVEVGAGTRVEPFSYLGDGVCVGKGCRLGPGAMVLQGCTVEDGVVLGPGAVVGSDGFGFWRDPGGWHAIPSRGDVRVGAGARIGAHTSVDRGTLGSTRIGRGAMLDNLIQVGHNCDVGEGALLCAQVGLAGSARVGAGAVLAGQVGIADHRTVGDGARVGAKSGVAHDVPPGSEVSGTPAMDHRLWLRVSALLPRLPELWRRLRPVLRHGPEDSAPP